MLNLGLVFKLMSVFFSSPYSNFKKEQKLGGYISCAVSWGRRKAFAASAGRFKLYFDRCCSYYVPGKNNKNAIRDTTASRA